MNPTDNHYNLKCGIPFCEKCLTSIKKVAEEGRKQLGEVLRKTAKQDNPTDNQTPQPVDKLDVIIGELCGNPQSVEQDEQIAQAKARLLQWGTRQRLIELQNYKNDAVAHPPTYIKKRIAKLQASLKDGGTK